MRIIENNGNYNENNVTVLMVLKISQVFLLNKIKSIYFGGWNATWTCLSKTVSFAVSEKENVCKKELTGLSLEDNWDLSCCLSVHEWFYECRGGVRFDKIVGHEGLYESG